MSTPFKPIQLPPGVVAQATKKMRSSNWSEVNFIRWREGQLMPMGGQSQLTNVVGGVEKYVFASRCKKIHGWYGLNGQYHIAYLCETNLYVDTGGTLVDITPVDGMTAPAGLVGGFGDGFYDVDTYGTPRLIPSSVAIVKVPGSYSLDNFGSILYAMTSADSRLLMWDPAVGGKAVEQPAASGRGPVPRGRCFVVTSQRFLMIFGSTNDGTADGGGFRRFAWCDQENPGAWDYTNVTSQAGFLDIEPASPIICAIASRVGVLFWTGKKVYASNFLGSPYIYNYVELADGTTPWSPQSMSTTSSLVLWMSEQGPFSYDGTSILPVQQMVRAWIDDNIDQVAVRELSFSTHLGEFNEWWWFFPTLNSPYNSRAVIYNYKEGWWSQARLSRSAGITSSYTAHPIFADDLYAFQHEVGAVYQNSVANAPVTLPFAESFDLNLASGALLTTVKQLIPDVEAVEATDPVAIANVINQLRYSLFYRNSRSLGLQELQSIQRPVRPDGYVDFRITGRDVRLRIDVANQSVEPFTLGAHLIDSVTRGDR